MTTLIAYYQENKEKLKSQLEASDTPESTVKIIQTEINKLVDINSEYIQTLTPPQARLARVMLQSLGQYTSILLLAKPYSQTTEQLSTFKQLTTNIVSPITNAIETQQKIQTLTSPAYYKRVALEKIQQSREIISSLLAGGLAGTLEGGFYWGLVGAIIGGTTGGAIAQIIKRKPSVDKINPITQKSTPKIIIDTDKLLDYFYQNLQSIDITISGLSQKDDKNPKSGIENNLDLLEYLQDLMADGLDENIQLPIAVRRRIEQAATILRRYGIEAKVYQPKEEQDLMFYFEPSLDPEITDYITLKHALVKDDQTLLPGYVIEPLS